MKMRCIGGSLNGEYINVPSDRPATVVYGPMSMSDEFPPPREIYVERKRVIPSGPDTAGILPVQWWCWEKVLVHTTLPY